MNYHNEIDPFAAQWLTNLIIAGHIAPGIVDTRSIEDVRPHDLRGFTQCHFFAGIGGWPYALRLAGWPDSRPIWTGSCPCQPFSAAGKGMGFSDERHLWPAFYHLITQCEPDTIAGEQVASKDGLAWLDLVYADLEASGYSRGAVDICAAGVKAPHIRQRLFWLADSKSTRGCGRGEVEGRGHQELRGSSTTFSVVGVAHDARSQGWGLQLGEYASELSPWASSIALQCTDGKARPVEPSIFPLAHGVSKRVGRLRGYGNAIVPQVAAEVIRAYLECRPQ